MKVRFKETLRNLLGPLLPWVRSMRALPGRQRAKRAASRLQPSTDMSVCYLTGQFPARPPLRTEISQGGAVKLTFLAETFPHCYPSARLLYAVSSLDHPGKAEIVWEARRQGLKIVLNQNGVAYPGWHGPGWELPNDKQREIFKQADFIIYQSHFCQVGAETFLGPAPAPSQVLYNPVDVNFFAPPAIRPHHSNPVLLLGGNQFSFYRFEITALTLRALRADLPGARLMVTGKLWGEDQAAARAQALELARKLEIASNLEFTGPYSQEQALGIFHRAHILIHPQFQDASPGLLGEALACGLPVVYSASGGSPELVADGAGIGIPVEPSWDKINTPDPGQMARAVLAVWQDYDNFSNVARQSALERFSLQAYVENHRRIFSGLLE